MSQNRIFIGSSGEQLEIARAVQSNLSDEFVADVWTDGTFPPSHYTFDSLLADVTTRDFGVFVFAPDDELKSRGSTRKVVRDNVLFEAGLFAGRLGRDRVFMLTPKGFAMPSDLIGITTVRYDPKRFDRSNPKSSMASSCNELRVAMSSKGRSDRLIPQAVLKYFSQSSKTVGLLAIEAPEDPSSWWRELLRLFEEVVRELWPQADARVSLRLAADSPNGQGSLETRYLLTIEPKRQRNIRPIALADCVAGRVLLDAMPRLISNVTREKDVPEAERSRLDNVGSLVCWPVKVRSLAFGVVEIESPSTHCFERDSDVLEELLEFTSTNLNLAHEVWRSNRKTHSQSSS